MEQVKIFNRLSVSYPDNFHVMDADEIKKHFVSSEGRWGIRDDEKHVTISVLKNPAPKMLVMLADIKAVIKRAEVDMSKGLKDYRKINDIDMYILGKRACGTAFTFTAAQSGESVCGEIITVKASGVLYTFYYTSRAVDAEENRRYFSDFLTSANIE